MLDEIDEETMKKMPDGLQALLRLFEYYGGNESTLDEIDEEALKKMPDCLQVFLRFFKYYRGNRIMLDEIDEEAMMKKPDSLRAFLRFFMVSDKLMIVAIIHLLDDMLEENKVMLAKKNLERKGDGDDLPT